MKPLAPPTVPGNTDWERFDNAVSMVLKVPKEVFLASEAKKRKAKARKKRLNRKGVA